MESPIGTAVSGNVRQKYLTEIKAKGLPYEEILAHVWMGVIASTLLLCCICCMCFCLLYHKFMLWKRSDLGNNEISDVSMRNRISLDCESLPGYAVASGLPSYEDAVYHMETSKK